MRVLMVTPGYFPITGGTESMVKNLSTELNKVGIKTDIMAFNMDKKWSPKWNGKIEKSGESKVFKIAGLKWFPISTPRVNMGVNLIPGRFNHILKQYDIIHYHEAEYSFPLFSSLVKKPKILHLHGINFNYLKRYTLSRMMLTHAANLYLSITKPMRDELIELGIPQDRVILFPNSVDTKIFYPTKEKIPNTILYVGRLTSDKGLHILLKSLDHMQNPVHLVIIGPQDMNLNFYNEIMKSIRIENQKGKHRITYLGRVDQRELIDWYQKALIFVLPSFFEAFPVVILEALSCGTPVVATPVGGVPEAILDGENGILVPVNNPIKLGEALDYLLENEDIRIKFGENGRKWVEENFSVEVLIKRLCNIYKGMNYISGSD